MQIRHVYISSNQLAWLAGLLEGEGHFAPGKPSAPRRPRVIVAMVDYDVIARVANLLNTSIGRYNQRDRRYRSLHRIELCGGAAVSLMSLLLPFMGSRRQQQIKEAVASYKPRISIAHRIFHLVEDEIVEDDRHWLAGY